MNDADTACGGESRPTALAVPPARQIRIADRVVGDNAPVFIVAEIGLNHDGSLERARALIDSAVAAGANAVKFQLRSLPDLYVNAGNPDDPAEDLSSQYVLGVLRHAHLDIGDMFQLFRYADEKAVLCLCTPWDMRSLDALVDFDLPALKVASADLTNHQLLEAMAATGKPLLVSTGMSSEDEICEAVTLLRGRQAQFALLHCIAAYPPRVEDLHLRYLARLRSIGMDCPVGYSGHERGWLPTVGAVALGASIVEKHLTLDRAHPGVDHKISLLPSEFAEMVAAIRQMEKALGGAGRRRLGRGERLNRTALAKSLVAAKPLRPGDPITRHSIVVRSPGRGLPPDRLRELIGRRALRAMVPGEFFCETDLGAAAPRPRDYRFRRRWGIPVRYHDFRSLTQASDPDFVEFHLSANDLDREPDGFVEGPHACGFIVHSPEQFADDFVIDLASDDAAVRRRSSAELNRVFALTRRLRTCFAGTPASIVVANLGGFTEDLRISPCKRRSLYERVANEIARLNTAGVILLAQTLPPFPWHFGGYRVGNLFTNAEDTAWACEQYQWRLCLDVAHTYMAAVADCVSFEESLARLGPFTSHLHICDASGVDGEGLQIGEGEIEFTTLAEVLERTAPSASFIPEIWEGHWNEGLGFWRALERLERWFGIEDERGVT